MALSEYDAAVDEVTGEDPQQAPATPPSPWDEAVDRSLGRQETTLRLVTDRAQDENPEQAADAQRIADHFAVPATVVSGHYKDFKARYDADRAVEALRGAPHTQAWLPQGNNAALAKDDHLSLATLEQLLQVPKNLLGATAAGALGFAGSVESTLRAGSELVDQARSLPDRISAFLRGSALNQTILQAGAPAESAATRLFRENAEFADVLARRVAPDMSGMGFVGRNVYGGIESAGAMAPAIALGVLAGPEVLPAIFAGQGFGSAYQRAREQGAGTSAALGYGSVEGAIQGALTAIPAHQLLGDLAAKSGFVTTLAHQLLTGVPVMEIQTAFSDLNAWAQLPENKDKPFSAYLAQAPSQAAATLVNTLAALGVTASVTHGTARVFDAIGKTAQQSKTIERAPGQVGDLIDAITKDGPAETVYLPSEAFATYWQEKGEDPATKAQALTGSPTALRDALATGQDLQVPMRAYVTQIAADEGASTFFQREARLRPEQLNVRELETLFQSTKPEGQPAPDTSAIRAHLLEQLAGAGVGPEEARHYASLYEAVYGTLGARAGIDPAELYKRYGLEVKASERGEPVTPEAAAEAAQLAQAEPPPADARYEADFARGAISFGDGGRVRIDLFANKNLSTFLHESGHLFLQTLRDLAPHAESIDADLRTLDTTLFKGADTEVEKHERFARAFEAYLREGKAPSAEVRPIFARFKAWLTQVYRSLRDLNVDLSPSVRGVFDRLVATDDAIRQAEAESKIQPLFMDAASAGMTDENFTQYRDKVAAVSQLAREDLARAIAREEARADSATRRSAAVDIKAQVTQELQQDPVFRARAAMKSGTHPDGTPLVEGQKPTPIKDVETAAELFGFSSADELRQKLRATPSLKTAIAQETARRVRAQFGDPLSPQSLRARATEAVNGEHRQAIVRAELQALTKGIHEAALPPAAAVKAYAEQTIASTRVRDLKPGLFLMAAQRASAKAFELQGSDRAAAIRAKQQELVNLALYREATKAREFSETAYDFLGPRFDRGTVRSRIGLANPDALDQIDALRSRFEFAAVSNTVLDRRASLVKYIEAEQARGHELAIPQELQNDAYKKNYRQLTVEELRGVYDAAKSIEYWARFKNRLLRVQAQRELDALGADGAASIDAHKSGGPRPVDLEPRRSGGLARKGAGFELAHRPLQAITRELDGYRDGFMFDNIWRPADEAGNREDGMGREANQQASTLYKARFAGNESALYKTVFVPEINGSLSLEARLAVALNYGNEGNRERLRSAGIGNTGPLAEPQIQAILRTLDARDWTYVRGVAELINSYRDQIGALHRRVTGVEPTWVEPTPFQTAHGEQPGWYYPIAYEGRASARALPGPEASFADVLAKSSYMRFTTDQGHTEQRVAHTGIPLRADLGVVGEHLQQILHDITHREMLIDAGRLLGRKDIQDAIYRNYGDQTYREIKDTFRDLAIGPMPAPDWYRTIEPLRRRAAMARLAWNPLTAAKHVLNITNGMVRVGSLDVLAAIPKILGSARSAESSAAGIARLSDMMANRWNHRIEEVASINNQIGANRGPWAAHLRDGVTKLGLNPDWASRVSDSYLWMVHKVIQTAEMPTWWGAYQKALRAAPEDQPRAIASANAAILDAFGGGDLKDLPRVQRSAMGKLFTTFATYGLSMERMNYEVFHRDTSVGRKIVDATVLNLAPILFTGALIHETRSKDSFAWDLASEAFAHVAGLFTFTRELAGALSRRDYAGPASLAPFGNLTRILYDNAQVVRKELDNKTVSAKAVKTVAKETTEFGGQFFGVPVYQAERTMDGLIALWTGKTKNPSAVLFGPPKKGS